MIHTIIGAVKDRPGVSLRLSMGTCRINAAVIRHQMAHASVTMTAAHTGEIPLKQIRTELSMKFGDKTDVLETMEAGAAT